MTMDTWNRNSRVFVYWGRIVIVAYGLEPTAAHDSGVMIDLRGLRASRRNSVLQFLKQSGIHYAASAIS